MTPRRQRHTITPENAARGLAAESTFRVWLDVSLAPFVYLDQSLLTVPESLRGKIKRPDYLVGVPGVGLVAFDVKSKTIYPEGIIFDLAEVQKLRTFAHMFHLSVFFACLDTANGPASYWVNVDQLDNVPAIRRGDRLTLCLPIADAQPVALNVSFYDAFVQSLRLPKNPRKA
jgi:hypothetical protein